MDPNDASASRAGRAASHDWPPRPWLGRDYYKAHGHGNDYLVFEEGDAWPATPAAVIEVCDRFRGVGADGIVALFPPTARSRFPLRMFNPDGGEFERSGNGLRVLASYLARRARVGAARFAVEVGGDALGMTVHGRSGVTYDVSVAMGRARVGPDAVALDPSALDPGGRLAGPDGEPLHVVPVSVGNPHLVALVEAPTEELLARLGPFLATHPALARGANVQLARRERAGACRALVWERGVGRTSASGTSACAVAVACVHTGLVDAGDVRVHMDGGELDVAVGADLDVVLRAPVEEVCEGSLTEGFVERLARARS